MKSQLKLGIILSYLTMFAKNAIAILYTPIMLRLLGQSEYGLYQLVYSVVSYLGLLSFGFGSAYVRFYSRYNRLNDGIGLAKLNGLFLIVFCLISIITIACGSLLIYNIEVIFGKSLTEYEISTAKLLMLLMVINLALTFLSSVFDSYVTANEKYFFQRIIQLLETVCNPFLALPLLVMGYKSVSLIIVTTVLTFSKLIINVFYCKNKLHMSFIFKDFDFSLFKEIGTFSFYIFINIIVDQINWSVDKYILGVFGGTVSVAIYSIGGQINTLYMNLSTAVSSVFIPRVNKIIANDYDDNSTLTDIFTKVGRIQFIILSCILSGFIIVGNYFISVWAGTEYHTAYYVALLLITPVTIPLIQNLGIEIQRAKNLHKFRSFVYLFIAVSNILISIPLTIKFGEIGAALGTAIALIVGNIIIMNIYYKKVVCLDMEYFWKEISKLLPSILFAFCIGYLGKLFIGVTNFISFITVGIIYLISFIILIYKYGFNDYEKELIFKPIQNYLERKYD
ncbi:MAG: oligosaccharide flippase family protein [Erysipelotrichaceae bacterium]|nr:oligosaccharide flippase family protein [Erysipelotrichaceae bacterium]